MVAETLDLGIVGAGPVGLQAAIAAKRERLSARVWDRGPLCASIMSYPANMIFFTSNELLEIGEHPLVSSGPKATRREALDYYRKVAERERLDVVTFTRVERIEPVGKAFRVHTHDADRASAAGCAAVLVATGYYDCPRAMHVPGEELPIVSHYFREAHPYWRRRVVIVGGGNSAAEAALELHHAGAHVTMLVRGAAVRDTVKYWLKPDLENRIREGSITAIYRCEVVRITRDAVHFRAPDGERVVAADAVFLMTGFIADTSLVRAAGAVVCDDGSVELDRTTFESTVPGLFVVGSAGFGGRTGEVFIENGRLHALAAVATIAARLRNRGSS